MAIIRLKDGLIWTLLTTMAELKGHEEKAGFTRPLGARHGVNPGAKTWKELREEEAEKLGYETQPYVLIIGGGQGAIGLGARLQATRRADDHRGEERTRRAIPGASATSRSACTIRSGTTICPISTFRRTGRCSRPRTRSAIGWKCTPR